jgi:hypothetical protein
MGIASSRVDDCRPTQRAVVSLCNTAHSHSGRRAYTPVMTLKNAALLALVGVTLATIVLAAGFIGDVSTVVRGLIPATKLLTSFIYAFAGLSTVVFLYAFHRAQS